MERIRSQESFYLPALTAEEKQDLRTYFSFYEKHRDDISDWAEAQLRNHPAWGNILKEMSVEERVNQRKISYTTQHQAIFEENWIPYLTQLNYYGIFYARIGMGFRSWFEVVNLVRRYLKPILEKETDVRRIITIMNGMDLYMDIVMSNIGEAYIAEKKSIIEKQKEKQELLNKELENFVYIASHDLQEPLNTVTSFVTVLEDDFGHAFIGEPAQMLSFIKASASRMKDLVSGLLDYSKVAGNREFKSVALDTIVAEVLTDLTARIRQTHATVEVGSSLPTIQASPIAMKMLFQNLIGNAIKFHRKGVAPIVRVSAAQEAEHQWRFTVEDNGIGIDAKDQDKAFVIFRRLNEAEAYEGTGIGLAHCKKIVESHGGRIWVESVPGQGSQFHFTLNELTVSDEKA
jgi:signal transduction histidine kinase